MAVNADNGRRLSKQSEADCNCTSRLPGSTCNNRWFLDDSAVKLQRGQPAGDWTWCGWPPYFYPRRRRVAFPRLNCRWRSEVPLLSESSLKGGNIFWRTTRSLIVFLLNRTWGNREKKRRVGRSGGLKTAVLCISAISGIHPCIYLFIFL